MNELNGKFCRKWDFDLINSLAQLRKEISLMVWTSSAVPRTTFDQSTAFYATESEWASELNSEGFRL